MENNHNKKPLLSIIIPTRNRYVYAEKVVTSILGFNMKDCEIVIQDNSDSDLLRQKFKNDIKQNRVVYNHIDGCISFCDNFNLAIGHARGEYLCIIGDDDIVSPEIINAAQWAKINNVEAITSALKAVYYWPSQEINSQSTGKLIMPKYTGKVKTYMVEKDFKILLKNGGQNYVNLKLPKIYHGVVRKDIFEKVYNLTGRYFGGLSPDIYATTALSCYVKMLVHVDYPLTLSGICDKSGSADSASGKHTGNLSDAPHFRGHTNYIWSEKVPKFYSVETIWADTMIHALEDCNANNYLNMFSIEKLSAYCIFNNKNFKSIILDFYYKYTKKKYTSNIGATINIIRSYILGPVYYYYFKRIFDRIRLGNVKKISGVESIDNAMERLQSELNNSNIKMDWNLLKYDSKNL